MCWLLIRYPLHPYVTKVACKRFFSFCWKCRWHLSSVQDVIYGLRKAKKPTQQKDVWVNVSDSFLIVFISKRYSGFRVQFSHLSFFWGQHFPPKLGKKCYHVFPQKDNPTKTIHSARQKFTSLIYPVIQLWKECSLYILVYKGNNGSENCYVILIPVLCILMYWFV